MKAESSGQIDAEQLTNFGQSAGDRQTGGGEESLVGVIELTLLLEVVITWPRNSDLKSDPVVVAIGFFICEGQPAFDSPSSRKFRFPDGRLHLPKVFVALEKALISPVSKRWCGSTRPWM